LIAVSFAQNQRGELRTSTISPQLTTGGGKPGEGYAAVLTFTERTRNGERNLEVQENLAYTLTNPGKGGRTQERNIAGDFGVRRLTPIECERLQGFEDDYTAWGVDDQGQRIEMSDSVRYRMCGNAVCKNVSAWLDQQIIHFGYE
jgi:DNA (cytosine-5)-methyltransferase 1